MPFSCLVPDFVTLYETYFPFSCSRREHFSPLLNILACHVSVNSEILVLVQMFAFILIVCFDRFPWEMRCTCPKLADGRLITTCEGREWQETSMGICFFRSVRARARARGALQVAFGKRSRGPECNERAQKRYRFCSAGWFSRSTTSSRVIRLRRHFPSGRNIRQLTKKATRL